MSAGAAEALAQLMEEMRAALEKAQSYPLDSRVSRLAGGEYKWCSVRPDDILVFDADDRRLDYPLEALRSSLTAIADRADRAYQAAEAIEPKKKDLHESRIQKRYRAEVLRQTATIRDSVREIVRLLNGELLEEPGPREFATGGIIPSHLLSQSCSMHETIFSGASIPSSASGPVPEKKSPKFEIRLKVNDRASADLVRIEAAVREAHIFKMIKSIMQKGRVADTTYYPALMAELQEVLDFIQYKQNVPTREDEESV